MSETTSITSNPTELDATRQRVRHSGFKCVQTPDGWVFAIPPCSPKGEPLPVTAAFSSEDEAFRNFDNVVLGAQRRRDHLRDIYAYLAREGYRIAKADGRYRFATDLYRLDDSPVFASETELLENAGKFIADKFFQANDWERQAKSMNVAVKQSGSGDWQVCAIDGMGLVDGLPLSREMFPSKTAACQFAFANRFTLRDRGEALLNLRRAMDRWAYEPVQSAEGWRILSCTDETLSEEVFPDMVALLDSSPTFIEKDKNRLAEKRVAATNLPAVLRTVDLDEVAIETESQKQALSVARAFVETPGSSGLLVCGKAAPQWASALLVSWAKSRRPWDPAGAYMTISEAVRALRVPGSESGSTLRNASLLVVDTSGAIPTPTTAIESQLAAMCTTLMEPLLADVLEVRHEAKLPTILVVGGAADSLSSTLGESLLAYTTARAWVTIETD